MFDNQPFTLRPPLRAAKLIVRGSDRRPYERCALRLARLKTRPKELTVAARNGVHTDRKPTNRAFQCKGHSKKINQ